ncbi:hypothetical protein FACS1894199_18020 [Bacteroidia bacterium]|nr:hypothetical protein FACS1894199_18020 [Bacteroidia bacterium]
MSIVKSTDMEIKERKKNIWIYANGKKKQVTVTLSGRLSDFAIHKREHPEEWMGKILDMKAVMK